MATASPSGAERRRSSPSPKTDELSRAYAARLEDIASKVDGSVAYLVIDLTTGQRFARRADEPFPTASAIKIGILHELFAQADAGRVALDDPKPLPAASRAGGSGILQRLRSPMLSLRDHALLMILLSDNTSTNVLIDTLGREAITTHMQALGAKGYKLRRRMMDGEAAARGDENVASPADLLVVMDAIRTGRGLQPASQAEAIRILREYGPTAIRAGVPVRRARRRQARRPRRRAQRGRLGGPEGPPVPALRDDQLPRRRRRPATRPSPTSPARRTSTSRASHERASKGDCYRNEGLFTGMKDASPQCRTLHRNEAVAVDLPPSPRLPPPPRLRRTRRRTGQVDGQRRSTSPSISTIFSARPLRPAGHP